MNARPSIPGRLNINQAPRALLTGVPGLTPDMVDQIISNRDVTMGHTAARAEIRNLAAQRRRRGPQKMKKLMPLVTGGGNVYRAQVVGDSSTPTARSDRLEVRDRRHEKAADRAAPLGIKRLGPGLYAGNSRVPRRTTPSKSAVYNGECTGISS